MRHARYAGIAALVLVLCLTPAGRPTEAQSSGQSFLGLGDSIGEAVQSADASAGTQPFSFLHLMSLHIGAAFPLPLIQTGPFALVGSTAGRSRIDPAVQGRNLAVSGADAHDLLYTRADAATAAEIDSETDLVLFPRQASQMEIVESLSPQIVAVWIGNNDSLSSVTGVASLDGVTGLTPLPDFTTRFTEIAARLAAVGTKAVFGTLPKVTRIAYLVDGQDLIRFTGQDWGLPAGSWTTLPTMVGLQTGTTSPAVIADPAFVLTTDEAANINARIDQFNEIIRSTAAAYGFAVADISTVFDLLAASPPVVAGVPLSTRFLGGLFSLDGVHPGNFAHAIVAQIFISALNGHYGMSIPAISEEALVSFFLTDPFIDKDSDGRVAGRPGAGLLETAGPLLGWSGDLDDSLATTAATVDTAAFVETVERTTGKSLRHGSPRQRLDVLHELFGLHRFNRKPR